MIPASDLWMLGLRPAPSLGRGHMAATSGAAQRPRELGEIFPDHAARPRRQLIVGLTCSLHWGAARRLLAAFHQAHPDVELVVEDLQESDLAGTLGDNRIDVAIAPDNAVQDGWHGLPLWRERLIAALPETSPLAQGNEVAPAALRAETVLLAGDVAGHRAFNRAVIVALEGHPASVMHYPVERDTLFDLVALGVGVTVCPGATTGAFYPGVCFRPIDSEHAQIAYSLTWTQTQPGEPLKAFIALAERLATEEPPHGAL
jgi:DNA-binding transcriptional LysR family regulator